MVETTLAVFEHLVAAGGPHSLHPGLSPSGTEGIWAEFQAEFLLYLPQKKASRLIKVRRGNQVTCFKIALLQNKLLI